ncbi:MAG TPA: PocR ligand-binding domain-containing protein, partial [Pyrinomonadaceae bacterium]
MPHGWAEVQEGLASASGLALLLVEGRQPPALAVANNNSICHALQSSPAHAHLCQPDCGEAHARAEAAGGRIQYRCHAGLHCFAAPVEIGGRRLAFIGGRGFLRVSDYRALAERLRAGDLADLLSADIFGNVIFASREDLEELAARAEESSREFSASHPEKAAGRGARPALGADGIAGELVAGLSDESRKPATNGHRKPETAAADFVAPKDEARGAAEVSGKAEAEVVAAPPAVKGGANARAADAPAAAEGEIYPALPRGLQSGGTLEDACRRAVKTLSDDYGVESLALMLRADDSFYATCVTGMFEQRPPRVALKPKEIKLLLAATKGDSIAVPAGGRTSSKHEEAVELFPL